MRSERSLAVAVVTAALFVSMGIRAPGTTSGPGAGEDPWAFMGPAPVLALNVLPIALPDAYATPMNKVLVVAAPGVLLNDTDLDGDPIVAKLKAGAKTGVEVLAANGGFTYTPQLNWVGTDTIRYCTEDQDGCSNTVVVTITVTGTPPLPTPTLPPLPTPTLPPPPTPTLPGTTPTLPPLPTPTLPGTTPTSTPDTSFEPGPSGSPSPSPSAGGPDTGGGAGPIDPSAAPPTSSGSSPGQRAEVDLAPRSGDDGPVGGSWSGIGGVAPNLEWAVPAAALAFPGLLVLLVGAIQTFGGAAWLPIVRRALRGTGVSKATSRYRYIVRTTE